MHETTLLWKQISRELGHQKRIKATINRTEYNENRVLSASISGRLFDTPGVGNAISRTLKMEVMPYDGARGAIPPLSEIRLFVRLASADGELVSEQYIQKGVFYADTVEKDTDTGAVTITAFDAMAKAELPFDSTVSDGQGGRVSRTCTVSFNDGFGNIQKFHPRIGDPMPTPTTPTHEGERFLSWNPNPDATQKVYRDMLFMANWEQKFTVTFESTGQTPQKFSCFAGDATPIPETPGKKGYYFDKWLPTPAATVTDDVTYTAQWIRIVAEGDGWKLLEDGTLIIDIPPEGKDGKTPEEIWREILQEIAPYTDDIIRILITDGTPIFPEILEELVGRLPKLEEIIFPPGVNLDELSDVLAALTVIQIVAYPNKSDYATGQPLDYTGLRVVEKSYGGTERDITPECVLLPAEGYVTTEAGDIMVDVRYQDKSLGTFWVAVAESVIDGGDWWTLYAWGTLHIFCNGDMPDYDYYNKAPWYDYMSQITDVIILDSVTRIGSYAFYYYTNLKSVTIPNSVTSIGEQVFSGCKKLTSVTIPDSVTIIGEYAFNSCFNLVSVTIGNSVTRIESGAFYRCDITNVTIPDSVTFIGEYAFYECNMTSVTIPDSVTSIETSTFERCSSLTSVIIPNSVTSIGIYAFGDCRNLTSVTIPDSVWRIWSYAFYRCTRLASVMIPDSVTFIASYAFYECDLTSVTINRNATVGSNAFPPGCVINYY